jgi:uncharacterized delta-60 repeat protein
MSRCLSIIASVVLALVPLVPLGCSTFSSDADAPAPVAPEADASASPDATDPVMGVPDRGLTVVVGDPKATAFVMQGGSLGLPVKLTRRPSSAGAVDVTVAKLPADVTADALTIPEGATDGTLTLRAKPTSVQGGPVTLDVSALEKGPLGTGATTKLTAFVRGGRGALDTTFAAGGENLHVFGAGSEATFYDAKLMAGGAIVTTSRVLSQSVLNRFTSAGVLDATFAPGSGGGTAILMGSSGSTRVDLFEPPSPAKSFIWALESGGARPTLFRRNIDGSPDLGFNATGSISIEDGLGGIAQGMEVIALPDGKALVLVSHASGGSAVSRWNPDGSLDTSYGTGGVCRVADASRMRRRAGGGVLVFGGTPSLVRGCTAAGINDTIIGTSPDYALSIPGQDWSALPDGGLVFLANVAAQSPYSYWHRFSATLVKNTAIGTLGDVGCFAKAESIMAQVDGGLLVAASIDSDFVISRFTAAAKGEAAFGENGTATFKIATGGGQAHLVKLVEQPDGRVLAIGSNDYGFDAAFLRFWP